MTATRYQAHADYTTKHDRPQIQKGETPRDYTLQVEHSTTDTPRHIEQFRIRAFDPNGQPIHCDGTNRTVFETDMSGVLFTLNGDRDSKAGNASTGRAPIPEGDGISAYSGGRAHMITRRDGSSHPFPATDNEGFISLQFIPDDGQPLALDRIKMILDAIGSHRVEFDKVCDFSALAQGSKPKGPRQPGG